MKYLTRVLSYLKPYKTYVFWTLFFAVSTTLLDLVPPWLLKIIIDHLVEGTEQEFFYWAIAGMALAYMARNVSNHLRIGMNNKLEQNVLYDMRSQLYQALQGLSLRYFENRSTGEIMSRVNEDVNNVERVFIDGVEQVTTAMLTLLGVTAVLFYLHWKLALAAFIPIPILLLCAWRYTVRAHDLYYMSRERAARLNSVLQDTLSGIKETQAFNRQSHEIRRFNEHSRSCCDSTLQVMRLWSIYSPSMMFLGSMGAILILTYGIGWVEAGELTVGSLVAFMGYLTLFYTPVNQLHTLNNMLQLALVSGKRVFEIIDTEPDIIESASALQPATKVHGRISFSGACFSYIKGRQVLRHITFDIEPGEKVALVGHTGSGKSTIVKLLLRFYTASAGTIKLDDYLIEDLRLAYLREQIGLVSQEPFLFNGTVAENILYGKQEASCGNVVHAAAAANANDFIQDLPNGYDTLVGERGVKLSGGERHRIAIARVFLKDPPILVLDEATASVDTQTETKIKDALKKLMAHRTTLIIAHRLSTLENADRILVIKNGQLVESGTHEDLIRKTSVYAGLFKSQVHL